MNASSGRDVVRLAMLGMIEGNGHPYSWSAIINGYDREKMARCPYPVIPRYLGGQPCESVRIDGARVTHIWTDDPADAPLVAAAARIEHVVADPRDVIGGVDAVIIATDDGDDHVARAAPFVAAGLPVFVDKPLATNLPDLARFVRWQENGSLIMSSSGLRYAPEIAALLRQGDALGELRWISCLTSKTWERYGIHALEAVAQVTGPGFESVRAVATPHGVVMHIQHTSGAALAIPVACDAGGSFGVVHAYGTAGHISMQMTDTYTAFRAQLRAFIDVLHGGAPAYPFSETVELMCTIIAGIESRAQDGAAIRLDDVRARLAGEVARLARDEEVRTCN